MKWVLMALVVNIYIYDKDTGKLKMNGREII